MRNYKRSCVCVKCNERINYKDYKIVKADGDYHFNCGMDMRRSSNDWITSLVKYSSFYAKNSNNNL